MGAAALNKTKDLGDAAANLGGGILDGAKNLTENVGERVLNHPLTDKLASTTEKVGGKIIETSGDALEKAKQVAEDVGETILNHPLTDKLADTTEKIGGTVLEKGGEALDKTADFTANLGAKVMATGGAALDGLQDKVADLGGNLMDKGKTFFDKAQEEAAKASGGIVDGAKDAAADSGGGLDDLINKAQKMADDFEGKVETTPFTSNADAVKGSLLDGTDDFFAKASRYAEGDYHNTGKQKPEGEITIGENPDYDPKKTSEGTVKGFEDLDGDGNEIIDDAIIIDDDEPDTE